MLMFRSHMSIHSTQKRHCWQDDWGRRGKGVPGQGNSMSAEQRKWWSQCTHEGGIYGLSLPRLGSQSLRTLTGRSGSLAKGRKLRQHKQGFYSFGKHLLIAPAFCRAPGAVSQGTSGTGFWEKHLIAAGRIGGQEVQGPAMVQREVITN